jgi:hypothetical protein
MTSLGSLVLRHYVQQQPLTVAPAKAKADIAHARFQSYSLAYSFLGNSCELNVFNRSFSKIYILSNLKQNFDLFDFVNSVKEAT